MWDVSIHLESGSQVSVSSTMSCSAGDVTRQVDCLSGASGRITPETFQPIRSQDLCEELWEILTRAEAGNKDAPAVCSSLSDGSTLI